MCLDFATRVRSPSDLRTYYTTRADCAPVQRSDSATTRSVSSFSSPHGHDNDRIRRPIRTNCSPQTSAVCRKCNNLKINILLTILISFLSFLYILTSSCLNSRYLLSRCSIALYDLCEVFSTSNEQSQTHSESVDKN